MNNTNAVDVRIHAVFAGAASAVAAAAEFAANASAAAKLEVIVLLVTIIPCKVFIRAQPR
jgi:hypothetical protein